MRQVCLALVIGAAMIAAIGLAQEGPNKVLKTAKVGGLGGFDYVNADVAGRRLYVARRATSGGQPARIDVYNLDTLAPEGSVGDVSAHGAVISDKTSHGFASSKPITMFDSKTLKVIKTIEVQGNPDGMLYDPFDDHVYVLSHAVPNVTVINAADGAVLGTIDIGGAPEQAAVDGKGTMYIDVEDKDNIAVVDEKAMTVKAHYDLQGKGTGCAGLGLDAKNGILFATCHSSSMVILSAKDGKILETLPIGAGTDGGGFNPATMEAYSSGGSGALTIVKEKSPTSFVVEQNVPTMAGAKTMTIDTKTNHVLLIAAEYGPAPAAAPAPDAEKGKKGGRGPARPMLEGSFSIVVVGTK